MTASGKTAPRQRQRDGGEKTYLRVPKGYLPDFLQPLVGPLSYAQPWLFSEGGIELGPIPEGHADQFAVQHRSRAAGQSAQRASSRRRTISRRSLHGATDEEARKAFANLVGPSARGQQVPGFRDQPGPLFRHRLFRRGARLSDADKRALIEFLKTL